MKKPKRYLLTYLWTWPFDVIMWLVVLLVRVTCGQKLHWQNGLWCEIRKGSWLYKKWAVKWSGLTLGHGGLYGPGKSGGEGIDTDTEIHEHIHVEQYEAAMLASFAMGLVSLLSGGYWVACAGVWLLGGVSIYCASLLQAWLRGEDPYRSSFLEESAYSQVARYYGHQNGSDCVVPIADEIINAPGMEEYDKL